MSNIQKINSLESIKANALEALIGAIYLDSNLEKTSKVISNLWKKYFQNINLSTFDPKSRLQEWSLKNKKNSQNINLLKKLDLTINLSLKLKF